ncbi:hypothetical protein Pint_33957 [Pistacia integerrima]|uniref:Uncharacterized protein n=1 Tax=Pistacia integerrima TaxID=434235 RepID=A0ACC0X6C5_9ROSI|nr:hypothetical protein Pint_33957 [Pistacia integerrima]
MQLEIYNIFQRPDDLWAIHSRPVFLRPHKKHNPSWIAIQKVPICRVHRACVEREIMSLLDHPFLPTLCVLSSILMLSVYAFIFIAL